MTGSTITLHAGQCGNQIGQEYWAKLCTDHGIDPKTGQLSDESLETPPPPSFFSASPTKYTPKAILFDLEPRVIGSTLQRFPSLFSPRNIHTSSSGSGAGNNWAQGFDYGTRHLAELADIIDHEADLCDRLELFQLMHLVAGGTGSGLGSRLLEYLADHYPKAVLQTVLVFPANDQLDVVVQPYNTVLAARRLVEHADACLVLDNGALGLISDDVTSKQTNLLAADAAASLSASVRFPGSVFCLMTSVLAACVPTPLLHFLTPTVCGAQASAYNVFLELADRGKRMVAAARHETYVAATVVLQGAAQREDVHRGLDRMKAKMQFAEGAFEGVSVAYGRPQGACEGMLVGNLNAVGAMMRRSCSQYDRLMRRNAFLEGYKRGDLFENGMGEFEESREVVGGLIEEYSMGG